MRLASSTACAATPPGNESDGVGPAQLEGTSALADIAAIAAREATDMTFGEQGAEVGCSPHAQDVLLPIPSTDRRCTDAACLGLLAIVWIVFLATSFQDTAGAISAQPYKLFLPRDFHGAYCGLNDGATDFSKADRLTYMMNLTGTLESIVEYLICSTASEGMLEQVFDSQALGRYRCACCKMPCGNCIAPPQLPEHDTAAAVAESVARRMADLTEPSHAKELFAPSGANNGAFGSLFQDRDRYFVATCSKQCDFSGAKQSRMRSFTYSPPADSPFKAAWDTLARQNVFAGSELQQVISVSFVFSALPRDECGYDARYCVPFPGINFDSDSERYCRFQVFPDIADAMGSTVDTFGFDGLQRRAQESLGTAAGDVLVTLDCFLIVAVSSLMFGFACMVCLRFFIKIAVWAALFAVPILLIASGGAMYAASNRCNGDALVQSARRHYADVLGDVRASWFPSMGVETASEALTGNGTDYRGFQTRTRGGRTCQSWALQIPHRHSMSADTMPQAGLQGNFCRNPKGIAVYIWCYTTDPGTIWEYCDTLGAKRRNHDCLHGYNIEDARMRAALKSLAIFVFALSLVWVALLACIRSRIRMAVAINAVAASFVFETPHILLVPFLQSVAAALWVTFWFYSVCCLLAQVPLDHIPKDALVGKKLSGAMVSRASAHANGRAASLGGTWAMTHRSRTRALDGMGTRQVSNRNVGSARLRASLSTEGFW
eukprot:CAMPEP_0170222662 /NCGR_PEP_ID=MMETSP0116_2-20130129/11026_1 /TAXON_ID=400756 /ORGANISM="Durinskia baltica, Strain CSIRO CS-38" /LENGTH=718 /DNA_ID=CAMNT_0010473355 /DNA_START=69 /DNA_END=2226 /DNA_ORIENTATION=-